MTSVVRGAGRLVTGVVPAAVVARLGLSALVAVVFLVVVVLAAGCWVVMSSERTERVSRILLAGRGDARCLDRGAGAGPGLPGRAFRFFLGVVPRSRKGSA